MKKVILGLTIMAMATVMLNKPIYAEMDQSNKEPKQVELTTEQKAQLSKLYKEKAAIEKKILEKYVEFGVLTKEIAEKIEAHKAEWMKKLEENGYNMKKPPHQQPGEQKSHPKF